MKVSIIVPVYNVEKYLPKCLDSLVNQTLKDIEIIVVNDGSKDNSQSIINQYKKIYPNLIKSIKQENAGQGAARNVGLSLAKGEYIAYVDSDDYIEIDMIEKMYKEAKKNNSQIVVCGNHLVNENYIILNDEIYYNSKKNFDVKKCPEILFDKMAVWNKLYSRTFLNKLNLKFRTKKWYEDFDFSTIVLLNASKITVIEEPLYYYVIRQGSTMNNSNIDRNLEILEAFDEIINYTKKHNLFNEYYKELEYLSILHLYLFAIVRIINSHAEYKRKNSNIKLIKQYVKNNFNDYQKNKYIKTHLTKGRKLIFYLIKYRLYFLIKILFKIKNRRLEIK